MAKYTFLLPAFKAKYLGAALDSILRQTYKDFEVIVSDDASPENLQDVVAPYLADERVTMRRNAENMGGRSLVSHWNLLVEMCQTDYLIMASDDDLFDPTFLGEIDQLAQRYPEVDVLRGRVRFIDSDGEVYAEDPAFEERVSELKWYAQNYTPGMLKCIANFVFKTRPLQDMGGFFDYPLAWYSDIATVLAMGKHGAANTRDVLFTFRMSGLNISSEQQTTKAAARKKMDATYQYDAWMMKQLSALDYQHSRLNDSIYASLYRSHKDEIVVKAVNYAKAVPLGELIRLVKRFRKERYFDSGLRIYWLVKEWIGARMKGK